MPVQVQLVHAEAGHRVVLATAIEGASSLAMAFGEGATAEQAEDRARARLAMALQTPQTPPSQEPSLAGPAPAVHGPRSVTPAPRRHAITQTVRSPAETDLPELEPPLAEAGDRSDPGPVGDDPDLQEPADPEDWSTELASLELQLQRLGWNRDHEATYLLRAFGHGSRARLTSYSDLIAYLKALEGFAPQQDPATCPVPLRRRDLLQQCDALLLQLGWDAARGRQLLEDQFGCSSRQQLSDAQLLAFNMVLESELIAAPASPSTLSSAGSAG